MTIDDLNYADIVAEASRDAALHGLLTNAAERDECLFVTIRDSQPQQDSPARHEVTFWTSGTRAFLVDLDQQWSDSALLASPSVDPSVRKRPDVLDRTRALVDGALGKSETAAIPAGSQA